MSDRPDPAGLDPARMEPIATLPVFFKLQGKRAVLAGGTAPAVWKAELLAAAGARVEVIAADCCPALLELAATDPAIALIRRDWAPDDLHEAAIALGAIDDDEEAARFQAAARAAGVPVNVIDKPAFCDFQFGTIVGRSPVVIGISTDGAAPVFGQAIRTRLEAVLPQTLKAWAEAAREWRPWVQARNLDFRGRRRFWEAFAALALRPGNEEPTSGNFDACLSHAIDGSANLSAARLSLIGAGSGAPDAVTLHAVAVLQDADVVFYSETVALAVINYARREAEKHLLPSHLPSDQAKARICAAVRPARRLVWLDGGNPVGCLVWADRQRSLAHEAYITLVEGIGRCMSCSPACPLWAGGREPPG